jgi:hypothetical protein
MPSFVLRAGLGGPPSPGLDPWSPLKTTYIITRNAAVQTCSSRRVLKTSDAAVF